jgi:hypothetical protein
LIVPDLIPFAGWQIPHSAPWYHRERQGAAIWNKAFSNGKFFQK